MFGILKKKLQDVISKFAGQKEKEIEKEAAPEPVPLPKPEPVPVRKVEPQPSPRAEPRPVPKPEPKPKPKAEPKPEPRPLPKVEPKPVPVAKPEPKPMPKPVPRGLPKVEQKPEAKPAPTPEPAPQARLLPKAEPRPEPTSVLMPEPQPLPAPEKKKEGFLSKLLHREHKAEAERPEPEKLEERPLPKKEEEKPAIVPPEEEPRTLLAKVRATFTTKTLSKAEFEKLFEELEFAMLENSVALEVVERIKLDLEKGLVGVPIRRGRIEEAIAESLARSIRGLFVETSEGLVERILSLREKKRPVVVVFVGVNGCGKTTTIAKLAKQLQDRGISSVMAAGDTFRAAAIHQLEEHATKLGVKLIKHDYGSDPAAVAFDAVRHAEAKNVDVVLIDTSGRMHSKANLMEEMGKIMRVAKPDLKVFVGEATVGNDAVEQAKAFNEAIDFDGIVLAKADIDEKGGAAISVSYVTGKPILALGTGQGYDDLVEFDSAKVLESLGLSA